MRSFAIEQPAVAEAFSRLRNVDEQQTLERGRLIAQQTERKRDAAKGVADKDAAVAEFERVNKNIQGKESLRASKHAIRTFAGEALGHGLPIAGGAKSRSNRFDVLDRLARTRAGLFKQS